MQSKLDDRRLRALKPQPSRYEVADQDNPGLRVRVSPAGVKNFALFMRDNEGRMRTITLGRYDPDAIEPASRNEVRAYGDRLTLAMARRKASLMRAEILRGADPIAEKKTARERAKEKAKDAVTLGELLDEYQAGPGKERRTWQSGEAPGRIRAVFAPKLDKDVRSLTAHDLADAMADYQPSGGRGPAKGQISRARAYLAPVLNWASGRGSFKQIGAHRRPRIEAPMIAETADPQPDKVSRDRVLEDSELAALLPALRVVPVDRKGVARGEKLTTQGLTSLHGPALRFILLSACRLGEVTEMRWRDVDFDREEWFKPSVKSTRGGPRSQTLPLSGAALDLLRGLPTYPDRQPDGYVFASAKGGPLMNWGRATRQLSEITGVTGWHRHDLRRSAATLMEAIGVAPRVIAQILAHRNPLKAEGLGGATEAYIRLGKRFGGREDPQREALEKLAEALH